MPGVQKPHWLAPVAQNASAHRSTAPAGRPSTVVTTRPAARRAGVTQATRGLPVHQDRAAPALPLRAAAVLGRAQTQVLAEDLEQGHAPIGHLDLPAVHLELEHGAISEGHRPQDRFAGMSDRPGHLSRRRFLATAGATAGAIVLGACGGGDDDADQPTSTAATTRLVIAQYFDGPLFAAGERLRAPFGLADAEGILKVKDTPEEIEVVILTPDRRGTSQPITLRRRADGLERADFPLIVTLPEAGIYTVRAELGGPAGSEMALAVNQAAELKVIRPGMAMPALQTPTVGDARGVNPICTREPACALHDLTVTDVLAERKPLALLVSTPGYCQVSICGPVLDVLLDVLGDHPDVTALHAEVYSDPVAAFAAPPLGPEDYTPTLSALGMHLEPALVLVGSDGKVTERFDAIFDASELDEALSELT